MTTESNTAPEFDTTPEQCIADLQRDMKTLTEGKEVLSYGLFVCYRDGSIDGMGNLSKQESILIAKDIANRLLGPISASFPVR